MKTTIPPNSREEEMLVRNVLLKDSLKEMLILLKHLKKHENVFQQVGSPCLSSFKIVHLQNDLHLRTEQISRIPKFHYI